MLSPHLTRATAYCYFRFLLFVPLARESSARQQPRRKNNKDKRSHGNENCARSFVGSPLLLLLLFSSHANSFRFHLDIASASTELQILIAIPLGLPAPLTGIMMIAQSERIFVYISVVSARATLFDGIPQIRAERTFARAPNSNLSFPAGANSSRGQFAFRQLILVSFCDSENSGKMSVHNRR